MIRPITIVTFLMACGSGLYLYQSKHEVQLLDRTIERTVHEIAATREQSRLLSAEWTMLNDPERLRQFSTTYLPNLKSIDPKQFTSLADLDTRLPAPRPEVPASAADEVPMASIPEPAEATVAEEGDEVLPVPPVPMQRPAQSAPPSTRPAESVATARPIEAVAPLARSADAVTPAVRSGDVRVASPRTAVAETKLAIARPIPAEVRPAAAESKSWETRSSDQHATEQRAVARAPEPRPEIRAAAPRPIVLAPPRPQAGSQMAAGTVRPQTYATAPAPAPSPARSVPAQSYGAAPRPVAAPPSAPYGGSLLGMARGSVPPAPRPTPINANYAN